MKSEPELAYDLWNLAAKAYGWPEATRLTDARIRSLRRATKDAGGLLGWKSALDRAGRSSFLTGKTTRLGLHSKWRANLDFFLKPAKLLALLEGQYDDAPRPPAMPDPRPFSPRPVEKPFTPEPETVRLAAMIATYRKLDRWKDANAIEERLAELEGRSPILVPAPDVAHASMPHHAAVTPPHRRESTITDAEWTEIPE